MKRLRAFGAWLGGGFRRPRAYVAVVLPIAIPLLLASVTTPTAVSTVRHTAASFIAPPPLRYADLTPEASSAAGPATLPEHSTILTVEDGDTLDSILGAGGLDRRECAVLTQEFGKSIDVRRLRPGNLLRFHYDTERKVDSVELKITGWGQVDAVRNGTRFDVLARPAEQRELQQTVAASIESSLYEALRSAGESPQLAQQIVDVFQWDIDFFALKKGDSFSLVVKKKFAGGDAIGYGPILAARFTHDGDTYEAFRHESPDGRGGYYSSAGTPLRKQFLRAPLQFTHITSTFSNRRFHPILKYFRPHHGVDYGAPVGTPVMTTADGVVVEAGYKGGEGNYIKVRHTSRIDTSYLHLSRFAKGVKRGSKVTQGDVIGYVGMTGLATGPHLDYRVNDNGTWLDPLKLKSITPDPLRGDSLRQFRANVAAFQPKLAVNTTRVAEGPAKRRALF
ncbi:MAG: peptidase [Acidobacteria bacterium]|nr:peptidase [Acidobacteriota bacterium]